MQHLRQAAPCNSSSVAAAALRHGSQTCDRTACCRPRQRGWQQTSTSGYYRMPSFQQLQSRNCKPHFMWYRSCSCKPTLSMLWLQALEFEAGQRNWLLQQDALHAAAEMRLRQEVAASQAAVEAHRTCQLADWAAQEQEDTLRLHQVTPAC